MSFSKHVPSCPGTCPDMSTCPVGTSWSLLPPQHWVVDTLVAGVAVLPPGGRPRNLRDNWNKNDRTDKRRGRAESRQGRTLVPVCRVRSQKHETETCSYSRLRRRRMEEEERDNPRL